MSPQLVLTVSPPLTKKRPDKKRPDIVGDYAHQAMQKYVNHIFKQEKGVLAHDDPEFLHQMRVGLRRLRTACKAFETVIVLPNEMNDRALKQLGKVLGRVRDLDVLQDWLSRYADDVNLKKSEKEAFCTLSKALKKQQKKYVVRMDSYLRGRAYKRFVKAVGQWLKRPQYRPLSRLPLCVALPDLQLPMMGQLLQHPGWLVVDDADPTMLGQVHDLRKCIKGVRYQMALFSEFYGEEYTNQVGAFRQMQDLLGKLQDETVLRSFLVDVLGSHWAKKIPSLNQYFQQQHQTLWQQWLGLRQPYLTLDRRDALYKLFLQ
ncbi:CHAD domain-containing protein [Leptothoe sp. PORK10 BA2]|uniref:CHAD domain-containing protein n=1 Tax=Leptothoe sp. PORK10 BA2 TaxID=3110254 RepID=UPI002B2175C6|nr:CHAD domain-containing protein [Leptothoe sp. PORK10 BA2]MEA5462297.1 CHAD domain-containing protein [Leptothoe sp. PORK10 BA2]